MTMKRRGFLGMLGAVLTVPALPMAAPAGYSSGALKVAISHAQKYPVISIAGLVNRAGLSKVQAEVVLKELAARDMVKLVGPSRNGGVRAASRILTNDPWGLGRTRQATQTTVDAKPKQKTAQARDASHPQATSIEPWLAHVRQLCVDRGMALSPRCFA